MGMSNVTRMIVGPIETNCFFLENKESHEVAVIDPGESGNEIYGRIKRHGMDLKAILLTHGHFDHITGIADLLSAAKADGKGDIPVYAAETEEKLLGDINLNGSDEMGRTGVTARADRLLKDGEVFELAGFSICCMHTPGHTEGSCCYYLESEGLLFSGDTLFEGSVGRTDFPTGSMRVLLASIKGKLFKLPDETRVLTGHGGDTTIGDEKRYNPFLSGDVI